MKWQAERGTLVIAHSAQCHKANQVKQVPAAVSVRVTRGVDESLYPSPRLLVGLPFRV